MSKALLLIGSPKSNSVSGKLGQAMLAGLAARGWESQTLRLTGLLEAQEGRARLIGEFLGAELTVLAAPVYVDAPPAQVMRALEFLAGDSHAGASPRRFAAVFNCGFPEAGHTDICLDVCRLFARDAGLHWAGGLGVGGGGALDGAPLESRGRMTAGLRQALDLAAASLAQGGDITDEARRLAARPMIPRWLYLLASEAGWLAQAWKHRTLFKLNRTPFRKP